MICRQTIQADRGSLQPDAGVAALRPFIAQIPTLGDMEAGLDSLLDKAFRFLGRDHLPALITAELPIGSIQLLGSDPAHRILNHLGLHECVNGIAFQQQLSDSPLMLFGSRYLSAVLKELPRAIQSPVQNPRTFFFQQKLAEIFDPVLLPDRLAVVVDPEHTAFPCRIVGIDINCKSRVRCDDDVQFPIEVVAVILALCFRRYGVSANQTFQVVGGLTS